MKNLILLGGGIVLSVLFLVFSTQLFEAFYYEREFSNEMYNQGIYLVVSIATVAAAWAFAALYYYAINSVRFSRWYHWLIVLVVEAAAVASFNSMYPESVFAEDGLDFSAQLFSFSIVSAIMAAVMFVVASFAMRWWSTNCRHTPIPE